MRNIPEISIGFLLFLSSWCFAQNKSVPRRISLSTDAALILNRASLINGSGTYNGIPVSSLGPSNNVKPGFYLNINALLGQPSRKNRIIAGLAVTGSQTQYRAGNYSAESNNHYSRSTKYYFDSYDKYYLLNLEAGVKSRLGHGFSIKNTLSYFFNLLTVYDRRGYSVFTETYTNWGQYGTISSTQSNKQFSEINVIGKNKNPRTISGFSYRAAIYYQLKKPNACEVFLFRNFALGHNHLPWWGLGLNYRII